VYQCVHNERIPKTVDVNFADGFVHCFRSRFFLDRDVAGIAIIRRKKRKKKQKEKKEKKREKKSSIHLQSLKAAITCHYLDFSEFLSISPNINSGLNYKKKLLKKLKNYYRVLRSSRNYNREGSGFESVMDNVIEIKGENQ